MRKTKKIKKVLYIQKKPGIPYDERERLIKINEAIRGYDGKTIIVFMSAFIPALIGFLNETMDFRMKIASFFMEK